MAADVKWIKLKVGMFDGTSFKRIKRAQIGGESYRDKLTAVWFELMDFAGQCNHSGAFIDKKEIPFTDIADIATMIDRDVEELKLCMAFYVNEGMVEVVDDVYMLSNWTEYQNEAGLDKIREQRRAAQARWRAKKRLNSGDVDSHVDSTDHLPSYSYSISDSISTDNKGEYEGENGEESPPEPPEHPRQSVDNETIKSMYNDICTSFPRCTALSDARKKAINARLSSGYKKEHFEMLFRKAEASSFLKGKNDRNWKANFDWLLKDANMAKVLDGNYDDHRKGDNIGTTQSNLTESQRYGTYI